MERWNNGDPNGTTGLQMERWKDGVPNGTRERWCSKWNDGVTNRLMEQWGSKWNDGVPNGTMVFKIERWCSKWNNGFKMEQWAQNGTMEFQIERWNDGTMGWLIVLPTSRVLSSLSSPTCLVQYTTARSCFDCLRIGRLCVDWDDCSWPWCCSKFVGKEELGEGGN